MRSEKPGMPDYMGRNTKPEESTPLTIIANQGPANHRNIETNHQRANTDQNFLELLCIDGT